ncbi:hypothetical protein C9374_001465 [Naegleria lovaniensis]|uniref:ubiquitinyl hydrolase 1 n=1 Tax=Naegleria lovaniensis TaxID=51637 RepID=A0AA88GT34_NAELO|nr:uncharacterized protein C9374_001465 [Naegleria lovaniensis]KAG2387871.1 hypothetical protein C9374_001465 [Naegleria lovaniensis]
MPHVREDLVDQITEAGFTREQAIAALNKANNNVTRAFDFLLSDIPLHNDEYEMADDNTSTTAVAVHHHNDDMSGAPGGPTINDMNRYYNDSDSSSTTFSTSDDVLGDDQEEAHQARAGNIAPDQQRVAAASHHQQYRRSDSTDNIPDLEDDPQQAAHQRSQQHVTSDPTDEFFFDTATFESNDNRRYERSPYYDHHHHHGHRHSNHSSHNNSFEDALNMAIQASLQDQKRDSEPKTPIEKYRKQSHIPIGLKNIGNTCYVNSLFQAFFMIPKLKQLVFAFSEEEFKSRVQAKIEKVANQQKENATDKQPSQAQQQVSSRTLLERQAEKDLNFVKEVQRLFAKMILTNRTFIDPSALVDALLKEGVDVNIGYQEDISEFYSRILILLERMFSQEWEEKIENKTNSISLENPLKQIFYGICTEELEYENREKETVTVNKLSELCNLILNVSEELNNFYASLDAYSITEIADYSIETNYKSNVVKTTWFKTPPPVLLVQLQRTSFDTTKKVAHKINLPFDFQEVIFLDRYLESNKHKTMSKREKIKQIKLKIADLENELNSYVNFQGNSGLSLEFLFNGVLEYVNQKQHELSTNSNDAKVTASSIESSVKIFENIRTQVVKKVESIKLEIATLKESVRTMFDDMHDCAYDLCAILVHEGSLASSGHYFIYHHDKHLNTWWKYNDMKVTEVTEEEVMKTSKGNNDKDISSSAYCLVYVDSTRVNVEEKHFICKDMALQQKIEENIVSLKESLHKLEHSHDSCCSHHHDHDHMEQKPNHDSKVEDLHEYASLEEVLAAYPATARDLKTDILAEKWKTLIPQDIQEEVLFQNKKFVEEVHIWIEQQKEKRERERKHFQHQYNDAINRCFQFCQGQVNSTYTYSMSLQNDARIASFQVFLCAIDQIGPMKFTIADQIFYSMFHRKLLDLFMSLDKSDQMKFHEFMNLVNLTISDIPDPKTMASLTDLYSLFCFVATLYHHGLHYLYRKTFDRSIIAFQTAIIYDNVLTKMHGDKKLSRKKDIITYTAVCLQQIFSRGLKTITKDFTEAMNWIRYAVEHLPLVWNSTLPTNDFVFDKILNYFPVYINENHVKIQYNCAQHVDEIIDYWKYLQQHPIFRNYNIRKDLQNLINQDAPHEEIVKSRRLLKASNMEIDKMNRDLLAQNRETYTISFPDDPERLARGISSEIHNVEMEYARDIQIHPMYNSDADFIAEEEAEELDEQGDQAEIGADNTTAELSRESSSSPQIATSTTSSAVSKTSYTTVSDDSPPSSQHGVKSEPAASSLEDQIDID